LARSGEPTKKSVIPRFVHLAEVSPEAGLHGSALFYRLYRALPPEKILVLEPWPLSEPQRRLPGVEYRVMGPQPAERVRLGSLRRWVGLGAEREKIGEACEDFQPEALVTLAHGWKWISACQWARERGIPFHLFVHDAGGGFLPSTFGRLRVRPVDEWIFGKFYRAAASRLCISPFMEERFRRRYGVAGQVIMPTVGDDAWIQSRPGLRLGEPGGALQMAYAGSLNLHHESLGMLGGVLAETGGSLHLFGEPALGVFAQGRQGLVYRGQLGEKELIETLHREFHAAFLPVDFSREGKEWAELAFPSKLTAYTAAGIPVLIRGPAWCSAIRWARKNGGIGVDVTKTDVRSLKQGAGLLQEAQSRQKAGLRTLEICQDSFSQKLASQVFLNEIQKRS
jgi:hypothetical protein